MEGKFRLLTHSGYFGFYRYVSTFGARVSHNYQQASDAEKVYRFKKNGRNAELFSAMIRGVAAHFGCGKIIACPGHTEEATQLQLLFGSDIIRTAEVQSRKYSHKTAIDYGAESATLELRCDIAGQRVLFVDDVATTGRTLEFYRRYLKAHGAEEVVCLCLGINDRLKPVEADFEISYSTQDAKSGADRAAAFAARHSDIGEDFDAAVPLICWRRRDRCENSLVAFAETYCTGEGGFLEVAPPPTMRGILDEMQTAIGDSSTPYHIRIARGHGKTSFMKCAVAWVLSYGLRRYVVSVSADAKKAAAITADIVAFMTSSPKWGQDFPEISVPLKRLGGAYQRARSQTCRGKNTDIRLSASDMRLPTMWRSDGVKYPASGAILSAVGIGGNARGLVRGSRRPDLVLFDDLQNDGLARSAERVADAAALVRKAFMGLAGHRKKIAAIMTSTPIEAHDLSETFAADRAWKTTTFKMVESMPKCFKAKDGADLWRQYADIYEAELVAGRKPHVAANRFYRSHRAEMDDGAVVLNPFNYDRKTEISAIQHALNIYFRDGEATFLSEYQMEPPRSSYAFELTADMILHRIRRGVPACTIPDGTVLTVAATDVNPSYAITTTVVTFDVSRTAFVAAYAVSSVKIPDSLDDTAFGARVFDALCEHGRRIASWGLHIDKWGVDAGGRQFDTVTRFVKEQAGLVCDQPTAMIGRAGLNWNPYVRSRVRDARNDTVYCRDPQRRAWLAFNADTYKEAAQKAWGAEAGAPGGLSLFDGGMSHVKFAVQVANETLVSKKPRPGYDGRHLYKWRTKEPHDYGDCLAMCYALAGAEGVTGDGRRAGGSAKNKRKVYNG